jgi:hypothetical protein
MVIARHAIRGQHVQRLAFAPAGQPTELRHTIDPGGRGPAASRSRQPAGTRLPRTRSLL